METKPGLKNTFKYLQLFNYWLHLWMNEGKNDAGIRSHQHAEKESLFTLFNYTSRLTLMSVSCNKNIKINKTVSIFQSQFKCIWTDEKKKQHNCFCVFPTFKKIERSSGQSCLKLDKFRLFECFWIDFYTMVMQGHIRSNRVKNRKGTITLHVSEVCSSSVISILFSPLDDEHEVCFIRTKGRMILITSDSYNQ